MKGLHRGKNAVSKAVSVQVYFHVVRIDGMGSDQTWPFVVTKESNSTQTGKKISR